ncbi:hypothetical protein BZM26_30355 [Paraburkholderia strydomiana]|nr:hypothetical protein BZM26_30355 [Paraburkholderia strydomiana]
MCYSAQVVSDYRKFVHSYGAIMDIHEFARLFFERAISVTKAKVPKAMERAFVEPQDKAEREINALIASSASAQATKLEQDMLKQLKRLAGAERALQKKVTKAAMETQRIATDTIASVKRKLEDLQRTELQPGDSRIFPGYYAPVMVMTQGRRVVKPMRYQCRMAGKPASYDTERPGTYNARRDSLEGFWAPCFGYTHAVLLVEVFYEHVHWANFQGTLLETHERKENITLEFRPINGELMHVACLWSRWTAKGQPDLLSFAAITDHAPPEVATAGNDQCIVPIKPENIDAWLNPDPKNLEAMYAILDDRDRPCYEHRLAA